MCETSNNESRLAMKLTCERNRQQSDKELDSLPSTNDQLSDESDSSPTAVVPL